MAAYNNKAIQSALVQKGIKRRYKRNTHINRILKGVKDKIKQNLSKIEKGKSNSRIKITVQCKI